MRRREARVGYDVADCRFGGEKMRCYRLALVSLLLIAASVAQAADYRLLRLDGSTVKWGDRTLGSGARVTYSFVRERVTFADAINCGSLDPPDGLLAASGLTMREFTNAFRTAFSMWEQVANIAFRFVPDPRKADILIGAQAIPRGIAFANVWPAVPKASPVNTIARATICLNPAAPWETEPDGSDDTFDLRHIAAHEIGHTIGLDHPGPRGQLMGYQYADEVGVLKKGDIRGAIALYGVPVPDKGDAPLSLVALPRLAPIVSSPARGQP